MTNTLRDMWNQRYAEADLATTSAARVLLEYHHLIPVQGRALDLACGLGANSLLLARRGIEVDAWDISDVAITRLAAIAHHEGLPIKALCCDVMAQPLPPRHYDLIVVTRFLERDLAPSIIASLKPGGLLFYQTWTVEKIESTGPSNPLFLLQPNELLRLFAPLRIVAYHDEGRVGDLSQGIRNEALLVAQRID